MADENPYDPADGAPAATDPLPDESETAALQRERDELYDRLLRKTAEFDNYRKRVERERREQTDRAIVELLRELLLVVDDFDRALETNAGDAAPAYRHGVELIQTKLEELLRRQGVKQIEVIGEDFDPNLHEAVMQESSPGHRDGEVIAELQRGYRIGERLLRPAKVKVGKGVSKRDYYEVLEVHRTVTEVDLKSSYRKLAMKSTPDKNPGDKAAEERFKECAEAYAVLADPEKRSLYDRFGHAGVSSAAGAGAGFDPSIFNEFGDFADILGNMFGFGDLFGARRRGGPQRGADLRYDLEITFEESAKGSETSIQIPRHETCDTCRGSGAAPGSNPTTCPQCRGQGQVRFQQGFFTVARTCPQCRGAGRVITKPCATCRGEGRIARDRKITVKIPAGIAHGQQLRLQNEGEGGTAGGPPGHLFVVVHVQEHAFFRRDGVNLFCEIPVHFTTLALGGEIQVPTLDGTETIKVPDGTETGTTLKIRGKGMPEINGRGRGDLFATVQVHTPRKLTKEQRQLLTQLAKTLPADQFEPRSRADAQDERNLFDRVKDMFG